MTSDQSGAPTGEPYVDDDGELVGGPGPAGPEVVDVVDDGPLGGDLAAMTAQLAELTSDLQRLQADYANYRKRVERDREQTREQAVAGVLAELLPVLDDIGRARAHGDLVGAFGSVGEALEQTVAKLGLERYGSVGDPFDPLVHEALTHTHSPDVTTTTCVEVYQPGYRYAGGVVRPARVVVADPVDEAPAPGAG